MTTWNTLLEQQALTNALNTPTDSIIPLNDLGVLSVQGHDAQSFLQNLVTNDVNALSVNQGQLAGLCNPKGRLFAVFLIIRTHTDYKLILPKQTLPILKQRLTMFILRSKVELIDLSDTLFCMGLLHTNNNLPSSIALTKQDFTGSTLNITQLIKIPSKETQRHLLIGTENELQTMHQQLIEKGWEISNLKTWSAQDIISGLPTIYPETKELFTPQQINLDLIDGVSFKKGCYPGQEVVARLHYLGKPSRRMFVLELGADTAAKPGQEVFDTEKSVAGHIIQISYQEDKTLALASLKLSESDKSLYVNDSLVKQVIHL
jgi:folate-binding protein YgfZ